MFLKFNLFDTIVALWTKERGQNKSFSDYAERGVQFTPKEDQETYQWKRWGKKKETARKILWTFSTMFY